MNPSRTGACLAKHALPLGGSIAHPDRPCHLPLPLPPQVQLGLPSGPNSTTNSTGGFLLPCEGDGCAEGLWLVRLPGGQGEACVDAATGLPVLYSLQAATPNPGAGSGLGAGVGGGGKEERGGAGPGGRGVGGGGGGLPAPWVAASAGTTVPCRNGVGARCSPHSSLCVQACAPVLLP